MIIDAVVGGIKGFIGYKGGVTSQGGVANAEDGIRIKAANPSANIWGIDIWRELYRYPSLLLDWR